MNKLTIIGNLTKDHELRTTTTGVNVCSFTVAVNRPRRNGEDQGADFFQVSVWRERGDNCAKYLKKGSKCAVNGRIQTGSYKDRDGKTVSTFDVVANNVEFLQARERPSEREVPERPAYNEDVYPPF